MSEMVFVLGGVRSGKSAYARDLVIRSKKKALFIATATAMDPEMKERIRLHKISRPKSWGLIEEPLELADAIRRVKPSYGAALVDCMGLWITNLLMAGIEDGAIERKIKEFVAGIIKSRTGLIVVVSNDVGGGIVPMDQLSRRFRDLVGTANQVLAKRAGKVVFMQAGIPMIIKGK